MKLRVSLLFVVLLGLVAPNMFATCYGCREWVCFAGEGTHAQCDGNNGGCAEWGKCETCGPHTGTPCGPKNNVLLQTPLAEEWVLTSVDVQRAPRPAATRLATADAVRSDASVQR